MEFFKRKFLFISNLDLKDEIITHKKISKHFESIENPIELNPYTELAEIFDDKFKFYQLLISNGIKTPRTILIQKDSLIFSHPHDFSSNIFLKPRFGTESWDAKFFKVEKNNTKEFYSHINRIKAYDDVLYQEFIDIKHEFKVLYLEIDEKCYWSGIGENFKKFGNEILILSRELLEIFRDFENLKNIKRKIKIFSLDFVISKDLELFVLEANIRPNALYKFNLDEEILNLLKSSHYNPRDYTHCGHL